MLNSGDPDETAHYEPSHLDLRCFQKPVVIAYGSERIKAYILRAYSLTRCRSGMRKRTTHATKDGIFS